MLMISMISSSHLKDPFKAACVLLLFNVCGSMVFVYKWTWEFLFASLED